MACQVANLSHSWVLRIANAYCQDDISSLTLVTLGHFCWLGCLQFLLPEQVVVSRRLSSCQGGGAGCQKRTGELFHRLLSLARLLNLNTPRQNIPPKTVTGRYKKRIEKVWPKITRSDSNNIKMIKQQDKTFKIANRTKRETKIGERHKKCD